MNATEARDSIKTYMDECGVPYPQWYVGIATDPRDRLQCGHGIDGVKDGKGSQWCFRTCENDAQARSVERWFVDVLGTDGGTGGGDSSTTSVYAYVKRRGSRP